jgi:outer membrane protein OmpA-like peptidoglycan-associated protein
MAAIRRQNRFRAGSGRDVSTRSPGWTKKRAMPRLGALRVAATSLALATAVALAAAPAGAADCKAAASTCIDSEAFWPFAGPSTFFSLASAQTTGARGFGFGLSNSLQRDSIVFRTADASPTGGTKIPAIGWQLTTSFLFSYGVTDRLELAAVAPVSFYQDGTSVSRLTSDTAVDVQTSAVRDLRIGAAYAILPVPRVANAKGIALLGRFDLSIPSGDRDSFGGGRTAVAIPTIALEERVGPMVFSANLGARLRGTTTLLGAKVGSQGVLALGVGGTVDPKHHLDVTGEVFALPTLVDGGTSPIQWLAGVRWSPLWAGDLTIHAGGGGSFRGASAQLLEPSFRATLDVRYTPMATDTDHDGVPDRDDKCPLEPEDRDGFEDADGCPDPDNDHDGIPDVRDACPGAAETVNGYKDDDGCPETDGDGDGVIDELDKCPTVPEDKEGYQDDDGCPEGGPPQLPTMQCVDGTVSKPGEKCDVDKDGVTDDVDACPTVPEDKDGLMDEDGCPEKDADEDGVGDTVDPCPLEPETINGVKDDDGCPEDGAHSLVTYASGAIDIEKPVRFGPGSATVTKPMKAQLAMVAQRLQGLVDRGVEKVQIEAWADSAVESKPNLAFAEKRANALKAALIEAGVPEALIKAKVGELTDPPAKEKANFLISVRTKRKGPLGRPLKPAAATVAPATTTPADAGSGTGTGTGTGTAGGADAGKGSVDAKKDEPKKDEPKKDEPKKDGGKP